MHDAAESACGGERLESRDAGTENDDLRGPDGAGRGHQQREVLVDLGGSGEDRAIAGEVGLARQRVHRLRPRDPWHELHREGGDARLCERTDHREVAVRRGEADEDRATVHRAGLVDGRRGDAQHETHPGRIGRGDQLGSRGRVVLVREPCRLTGTSLDGDHRTEGDELTDGVRRGGDASFAGRPLTRDQDPEDCHRSLRARSGRTRCGDPREAEADTLGARTARGHADGPAPSPPRSPRA